MNKYVIITPAIGNMGGAQKYTENKIRYLQAKGWEVFVFFYLKPDNIKLPLLSQFKDNWIPELLYWYYSFTKKRQNRIIERIRNVVGDNGTIIVETHLLSLTYWGELIARGLGACHIINFLEEGSYVFSNRQYEFFEYKLKRWQILNAEIANIHRIFGNYYKDDYKQYQNPIRFDCSNVVDNNAVYNKRFKECDYTIITIGRLEKPYVMPMVDEIKHFGLKYCSKKINVIFVGGSPDGSIENRILNELSLPQINVYMLGYLYPIPYSLLKMSNVAIGSANAVLVTADNDIPTISLDWNDGMAIGVYGYTTTNKWTRQNEPQQRVFNLLEEVLIEKKYLPKGEIISHEGEMNEEFARQLKFVEKSFKNKGYYDVNSIPSCADVVCAFLKRMVHSSIYQK